MTVWFQVATKMVVKHGNSHFRGGSQDNRRVIPLMAPPFPFSVGPLQRWQWNISHFSLSFPLKASFPRDVPACHVWWHRREPCAILQPFCCQRAAVLAAIHTAMVAPSLWWTIVCGVSSVGFGGGTPSWGRAKFVNYIVIGHDYP